MKADRYHMIQFVLHSIPESFADGVALRESVDAWMRRVALMFGGEVHVPDALLSGLSRRHASLEMACARLSARRRLAQERARCTLEGRQKRHDAWLERQRKGNTRAISEFFRSGESVDMMV